MIVEGEPPLPEAGSLIRAVGVRINGAAEPAGRSAIDGIANARSTDPSEHLYALTGVASEARDVYASGGPDGDEHQLVGAEFVLSVGSARFQARVHGPASDVRAGSRVTVTGRLGLVGAYEWDAFELVDTRSDWLVAEVQPLPDGGVSLDLSQPQG